MDLKIYDKHGAELKPGCMIHIFGYDKMLDFHRGAIGYHTKNGFIPLAGNTNVKWSGNKILNCRKVADPVEEDTK